MNSSLANWRNPLCALPCRAQAAGIRLALDIPQDVAGPFDSLQVQQMLDNLLSNAIKY